MSSPFCFACSEHLRLRGHLPAGCRSKRAALRQLRSHGDPTTAAEADQGRGGPLMPRYLPMHLSPNAAAFLNAMFAREISAELLEQIQDGPAAAREISKVTGEALRRSGRPFAAGGVATHTGPGLESGAGI